MELTLTLDKTSGKPIFQVLSDAIKQSIVTGQLKPGQAMPSLRELAEQYSISKTTAMRCYEDLVSQGYIVSAPKSGTFVSKNIPGLKPAKVVKTVDRSIDDATVSPFATRLLEISRQVNRDVELNSDLNFGMPGNDDLPLSAWRKALYAQCSDLESTTLPFSEEPFGSERLRAALAAYLQRARAITCAAAQILIVPGPQQFLDLFCRLFVERGSDVVMENPGYPGARRTFLLHEAAVTPMAVDESGLKTALLVNAPRSTRIVYTTPSHQDPTGATLCLERRKALLAWAGSRNALVFEDDYDHELRYTTEPLPSLFSLDSGDCVFYVGSFYRSMGPLVRLGYVVLPQRFVDLFKEALSMLSRNLPVLEQEALAQFISDGQFETHIQRLRARLAKRRQMLIHELVIGLRQLIQVERQSSGMHVLCHFAASLPDAAVIAAASQARLPLKATSDYYGGQPAEHEFMISFAHMSEEQISLTVREFVRQLSH